MPINSIQYLPREKPFSLNFVNIPKGAKNAIFFRGKLREVVIFTEMHNLHKQKKYTFWKLKLDRAEDCSYNVISRNQQHIPKKNTEKQE